MQCNVSRTHREIQCNVVDECRDLEVIASESRTKGNLRQRFGQKTHKMMMIDIQ